MLTLQMNKTWRGTNCVVIETIGAKGGATGDGAKGEPKGTEPGGC